MENISIMQQGKKL